MDELCEIECDSEQGQEQSVTEHESVNPPAKVATQENAPKSARAKRASVLAQQEDERKQMLEEKCAQIDETTTSHIKSAFEECVNEWQDERRKKVSALWQQNRVVVSAQQVRRHEWATLTHVEPFWDGRSGHFHAPFPRSACFQVQLTGSAASRRTVATTHYVPIETLPRVTSIPQVLHWSTVQHNVGCEDELELPFVPYLSDDKKEDDVFLDELARLYSLRVRGRTEEELHRILYPPNYDCTELEERTKILEREPIVFHSFMRRLGELLRDLRKCSLIDSSVFIQPHCL